MLKWNGRASSSATRTSLIQYQPVFKDYRDNNAKPTQQFKKQKQKRREKATAWKVHSTVQDNYGSDNSMLFAQGGQTGLEEQLRRTKTLGLSKCSWNRRGVCTRSQRTCPAVREGNNHIFPPFPNKLWSSITAPLWSSNVQTFKRIKQQIENDIDRPFFSIQLYEQCTHIHTIYIYIFRMRVLNESWKAVIITNITWPGTHTRCPFTTTTTVVVVPSHQSTVMWIRPLYCGTHLRDWWKVGEGGEAGETLRIVKNSCERDYVKWHNGLRARPWNVRLHTFDRSWRDEPNNTLSSLCLRRAHCTVHCTTYVFTSVPIEQSRHCLCGAREYDKRISFYFFFFFFFSLLASAKGFVARI